MPAPTLQHVVGRNVRRIRDEHNIRQDDLARWTRDFGLKWSASRIGELENGRLGLSVSAFVILAHCLSSRIEGGVTLAALLEGSDGVALSDTFEVHNVSLQRVFAGDSSRLSYEYGDNLDAPTPAMIAHMEVIAESSARIRDAARTIADLTPADLATQRAARRLKVSPRDFMAMSIELFGRSLPDERDRLAGPNGTPQKRGSITRHLVDAIEHELRNRERG